MYAVAFQQDRRTNCVEKIRFIAFYEKKIYALANRLSLACSSSWSFILCVEAGLPD
jgi:hypothetical protein